MIKNNNYLDSLPKSLIDDVRSVMESKCKKGCECDKCSCEKEEKGEKEEKEMKEGYNKDAVDNAIASSNRSGKKIGGREAKMIHALLKGREKKSVESDDEKVARLKDNMNKRDNYLKNKHGGLAKIGEEAEQIDEISKKLATDYFHAKQDKARKDFMRGRPTNKKGIMLAKAKIEGDAKVPATRNEETSLEEKLKPSMGAAKYIQDFVKSKDPRFEGKTKKERIKMALGAFYGAKNESVETEETDTIDEAYGDKRDYKKHHIYVNGRYIATTTWARNAKEAEKKFLKAHPEHKNKRISVEKEG